MPYKVIAFRLFTFEDQTDSGHRAFTLVALKLNNHHTH